MNKEMYVANVRSWLMDLAIGALAAQRNMQFADAKVNEEWKVTASCYNTFTKGVAIHGLKNMAEAIGKPVSFYTFTPDDYEYGKYPGYYYIDIFGVKFYDYATEEEVCEVIK